MSLAPIPADLLAAYCSAEYRFEVEGSSHALVLNEPCTALQKLFVERDLNAAAFITAFNPYSQIQSPECNARRHRQLQARVVSGGYDFLTGSGADPSGEWPPEISLLILGMDHATACELGSDFAQHAILWIGSDCTPRLVLPGSVTHG